MKKKIFIPIFLLLIIIANISYASYSNVTMSVVEEPVCTIQLDENAAFEKRLISKNLNNKEVTIQLKVTNNKAAEMPNGEAVLVIDNSGSMIETTSSGATRGELIIKSAKTLVSNLLKDNDRLKIGLVSFSTTSTKNDDGSITVGTEKDATLLSNLTSDTQTLTKAIDNIIYPDESTPSYTDLQAGLNVGKKLFSAEKNNKYLIILTDGIPNVVLNQNSIKYDENIINTTKSEYQSITSSGINVITMLSGIENGTLKPSTSSPYTYDEYIEAIFGTSEKPNFGSFFYVKDDEIEKTIVTDIYNSLLPITKELTNIKITDYFPDEIINNFDLSYVEKANIGDISASINKTDKSITWNIPKLSSNETAIVQYKLKLIENYDSNIVDKIINTNEKVNINYNDFNNKSQTKTSDVTPKIKLTEPKILPKAGMPYAFMGLLVLSIIVLIYTSIKFFILRNNLR